MKFFPRKDGWHADEKPTPALKKFKISRMLRKAGQAKIKKKDPPANERKRREKG